MTITEGQISIFSTLYIYSQTRLVETKRLPLFLALWHVSVKSLFFLEPTLGLNLNGFRTFFGVDMVSTGRAVICRFQNTVFPLHP